MSDPRAAWSESRLERQSSMSPDGIDSRLKADEAAAPAAARRSPRPRRRGWAAVGLGGVACIALAAVALYGLRSLLHR
jgi:ferric-dicitrate binding protein FerR (iron transport regulator)